MTDDAAALLRRPGESRIDAFARWVGREPTIVEKNANIIQACRDDPVMFNDIVLARTYRDHSGEEVLARYWSRQIEICQAIVKYKTVVAPTGNSVGKSFLLAGIVLWWLVTRPGSAVIITAPSQTLLGSVVYKEIRRAHATAAIPLGGTITDSPKVSPQTLTFDNHGWHALGIATRGVERLSGQHDPQLLVAVDEASGVDADIWEAIDSLNAYKLCVFGNPLRAEGRFKEYHDRARRERGDASIPEAEKVHEIRIASTESPDIEMVRSPRGLADLGFLKEAERQYGRDSLWWRSHIDALYPESSTDTLLPVTWIDACPLAKRTPLDPAGHVRIAVDLGEGVGRDRSVVLVRDDLGIREIFASPQAGPPETADIILQLQYKYGVDEHRISYDGSGMLGKSLGRQLKQRGCHAALAYFGSGAGDSRFTNLRSRCAFRLRQRLDPDVTLDPTPGRAGANPAVGTARIRQQQFHIPAADWWHSLREELSELKYELDGKKTKLENKEAMAARLGRSPDLADALLQSFAYSD